jgi:hypothetical protein
MVRKVGIVLGAAALAAAGACGGSAAPTQQSDLARDLAAAGATDTSSLSLAPTAGRTDVISSVEQSPEARRAPKLASRAPTIVHSVKHQVTAPTAAPVVSTPAPVAAPAPTPVAPAPKADPAPSTTEPVMQRPQPIPQEQQHHGRWKTEAEVIRDAPFPITP